MKPKVILYCAVSLDGRTTGFDVDLGLFYGLAGRFHEDVSLVGSDTLLAAPADAAEAPDAAPPPPAPAPDDPRPLLVVPDSRGRVRGFDFLRRQPYWRGIVVLCAEKTPAAYRADLERQRIPALVAGRERVDYALALERLHAEFGTRVVRVDSGGTLNAALLRAGLVDELHLLVHPTLLGGAQAKTFFNDAALGNAGPPIALSFAGVETLGNGLLLLQYTVAH